MSNNLESIKSTKLLKSLLVTLFQEMFKNLLQSNAAGLAQKIPFRYYKISGIISGALVASQPFIVRFFKKKYWVLNVILGIAEILTVFLAEKQKEQNFFNKKQKSLMFP